MINKRLIGVNKLYQKYGDKREVARRLNISTERVRQLLVQGYQRGLFKYKTRVKPGMGEQVSIAGE
ncbi:MAG: hypothetical protein ABIH89_03185 [Elusimicrobiota bacterium]